MNNEKLTQISDLLEKNFIGLENSLSDVKLLDDLDFDLVEKKVSETSDKMNNIIRICAQESIEPQSENGKKVIDFGNFIRNLGHKILNLFEIHLSVSFAGVTLFVFDLPKIRNNKPVKTK